MANNTFTFGVSGMPLDKYKEWVADAKKNFGDVYWMKMYNDHLQSKQLSTIELLSQRVAALEQAVNQIMVSLNEKEEEQKLENITFGDTK